MDLSYIIKQMKAFLLTMKNASAKTIVALNTEFDSFINVDLYYFFSFSRDLFVWFIFDVYTSLKSVESTVWFL